MTEFPRLPTKKLLKHTVLLQKATEATLTLIEALRLEHEDLAEEHRNCASKEKEATATMAKVQTTLVAEHKKSWLTNLNCQRGVR